MPRFQFSLRRMFNATSILAVWAAMFPLASYINENWDPYNALTMLAMVGCMSLVALLPFIAIGALFGQARAGCMVGAIVAFTVFVLLLSWVA